MAMMAKKKNNLTLMYSTRNSEDMLKFLTRITITIWSCINAGRQHNILIKTQIKEYLLMKHFKKQKAPQ
jgi:hypothetical protein